MSPYKIIFTGPVGAGKSTAIASISDINVITTDEQASDMTQGRKAKTTVAMDYGMMKLGAGQVIHLYGTPGQERFNFMWDILTQGGIGLILLLDNTRHDPFKDLHFFIESFRDFIDANKMAIGITQVDVSRTPTLADYHAELEKLRINPPLFEVDARRRDDVATLIEALLYSLDPWLGD